MALMLLLFIVGAVVLPLMFSKIVSIKIAQKKPMMAFLIASFFILIGFFAAFFIFFSELSIGTIAFSSLFMLPFVIGIRDYHKREKKLRRRYVFDLFRKHDKVIQFYAFLFFGMALSYTFLFTSMPQDIVNVAFETQLGKFQPGSFVAPPFLEIVQNNLQIVVLAFSLSIFYGAGSILILNYNASVIGAFYGFALRSFVWGTPITLNLISLLPHTFLEVLAYLMAAIGGGLIMHGKKDREDAASLFVISVIFVLVAAYLEVTIAGTF